MVLTFRPVFLVFTIGCIAEGCVLLVGDREDLGTTCHFEGEDSQCGVCAAKNCRVELDACCADANCRPLLDALDQCATGKNCGALADAGNGKSATGLSSCLANKCKASCVPTQASKTNCEQWGSGDSCHCQIGSGVNATVCNQEVPAGSICCADLDWPASGTECSCDVVHCETTSTGCECSPYSSGPYSTCSNGGNCCVHSTGNCECGELGCVTSYDSPVGSCSRDVMDCGDSKQRVASCSLFQ